MASLPRQPSLFDRHLVQVGNKTMIESICICCGARIVGSINDTLLQDEAEHISECPGLRERSID